MYMHDGLIKKHWLIYQLMQQARHTDTQIDFCVSVFIDYYYSLFIRTLMLLPGLPLLPLQPAYPQLSMQ